MKLSQRKPSHEVQWLGFVVRGTCTHKRESPVSMRGPCTHKEVGVKEVALMSLMRCSLALFSFFYFHTHKSFHTCTLPPLPINYCYK